VVGKWNFKGINFGMIKYAFYSSFPPWQKNGIKKNFAGRKVG